LCIAEAVKHPVSLALAYEGMGLRYLRQGPLQRAVPVLERAVGLCEEADLRFHFSRLTPLLGSAYILCGRVDEAVQLVERTVEQATSGSIVPIQLLQLASLAETHLHTGRLEEAQRLATQAREYFQPHRHRGREAYTLHLLGDIAAHCEPPKITEGEVYYGQALALTEELGMRPLQAHCHRGLGTLYAKIGRPEHARAHLAAVDLYRSMAMTCWLPEAETALARVKGG
jgi:tetratricopeptide (TPR) repeat protein